MDDIGKEAEAIRFDRVAFVVAGQQILRNVSLSISAKNSRRGTCQICGGTAATSYRTAACFRT
jgi:hypothetical protein